MSLMVFVSLVLDWGLTTFSWRRWSEDRERYRVDAQHLVGVRTVLTLITALVVVSFTWFREPHLFLALTLAFFTTALEGVRNIPLFFCNATNQFPKALSIHIVDRGLGYALATTALLTNQSLEMLLGCFLISRVISLLWGWYIAPFPLPHRIMFKNFFTTLRSSLHFFLLHLLTNLYFRIDTLMIAQLLNLTETGLYSAAYRILESLLLVPQVMTLAFFAPLAQTKNTLQQEEIVHKALKYMGILGIGLAVFLTLFSKDTMQFLYGSQFAGAAPVAFWLGWTIPLVFLNSLLNTVLLVRGKEKQLVYRSAGLATLNVCLNFLSIPVWGIAGAAVSTLITETVNIFILTRLSAFPWKLQWLLPSLAFAVFCFGIMRVIPVHVFFQGSFGMLSYVALLVVVRVFEFDDFRSKA